MPRLPRPVKKPRPPKAPLPRWKQTWRWYQGLPQPARHGFAFGARICVLTGALYLNATHFDKTEYRTIIAMAVMDAVGFKRRT